MMGKILSGILWWIWDLFYKLSVIINSVKFRIVKGFDNIIYCKVK